MQQIFLKSHEKNTAYCFAYNIAIYRDVLNRDGGITVRPFLASTYGLACMANCVTVPYLSFYYYFTLVLR